MKAVKILSTEKKFAIEKTVFMYFFIQLHVCLCDIDLRVVF